jgi:hypothetical protein
MSQVVRSITAAGVGSMLQMAAPSYWTCHAGLYKAPMRASRWVVAREQPQPELHACCARLGGAVILTPIMEAEHALCPRGRASIQNHLKTARSINQLHTDLGQVCTRLSVLGCMFAQHECCTTDIAISPQRPCSGCCFMMQGPDTCHVRSKMPCNSRLNAAAALDLCLHQPSRRKSICCRCCCRLWGAGLGGQPDWTLDNAEAACAASEAKQLHLPAPGQYARHATSALIINS